ncbi:MULTISPECIES: hypothetical protein [Mycolicibacterium]|uniref:Uncharacterized protein n=1 Tax=Mycobacterium phage Bipper TaxID=1805457 RepID=A0A142F2N4_9CAUD|nr:MULTISPECIES: hypothetical protein [Mycolicibacterium]YP_009303253.1 hypothetical protein KCH39_gp071 [Mycobacterium phage Bipper]QDF19392.1 hypothetical protein SEA_CRACKLEWINK_106 [Mycobacterium phage Cracklewink]AMQ67041.1 hypothetical protein SEA_BIPPER_106 [Mycobacterium phage Bipper]MCC9181120.1 hypothetical protein [Mycolicibacterium mageritense]UBV14827.1 hypothetical protein H8Z57_29730 [Mycolicibacterium fortuitum]
MTEQQRVWRFPGDTAEDKAKRVALSYRRLAEQMNPDAVANLDRQWQDQGVYWTVPSDEPIDHDAWLTAADMVLHLKHLVTLNEQQIRQMAYRKRKGRDGIIEEPGADGRPRYNVGDLLAYLTRQRTRRQGKEATA